MPSKPPLLILPILEGRHECMITRLKHEEDSFTFHYRITPPLPDSGSAALVLPLLEAQDDLGNEYEEYEDRGGAYGTHPDGTCTDGSLSGHPALHRDASSLRLRTTWLRGGVETSCDMPLTPS